VNVVGVEPKTCNTLHAALAARERVAIAPSGLAADSLGASTVGRLMFPIALAHVAHVVLVGDDEIREAQRALWRTLQLVTEPGGAAAFAALLSGAYRPARDERVGVILCGANTSLDTFAALFDEARLQ
jgi:threonine dehydratase